MAVWSNKMFVDAASELLGQGYAVRFMANGQSMHPAIKDGEMITVEPVTARHVKPGDIVLYRSTNGVIAHRVLRIDARTNIFPVLILRGDASTSVDEPVVWQDVLGRVAAVERSGRSIRLADRKSKLIHASRVFASRLKQRFALTADR